MKNIHGNFELVIYFHVPYCSIQENANNSFSKGLIISRNNVRKDNIQWIYDCAQNDVLIEDVFKTMKIA
jgi:hypothetical protein